MPFQIVKPGTHIDFLSRWRVCVSVSVLVILLGLAAIPLRGFRLGIDFAGGTEVQVGFVGDAPVDEGAVRSVVDALGIENASVIRYGEESENEFLIKFRGGRELTAPDAEAVAAPTEEGASRRPRPRRPPPRRAPSRPARTASSRSRRPSKGRSVPSRCSGSSSSDRRWARSSGMTGWPPWGSRAC